jgi:GGDEF domain-containing protein
VLLITIQHSDVEERHGIWGTKAIVREIAARLSAATYDGDAVARLSALEFAVIAHCVGGDPDELALFERDLEDAISSRPVDVGRERIHVTASLTSAIVTSAAQYFQLIEPWYE